MFIVKILGHTLLPPRLKNDRIPDAGMHTTRAARKKLRSDGVDGWHVKDSPGFDEVVIQQIISNEVAHLAALLLQQ